MISAPVKSKLEVFRFRRNATCVPKTHIKEVT